jgi:hypothetical protein
MDGSGFAIFEAGLVDFRGDEMWALGLDFLKYGLLHDLGQVRSHHNGSYLIKVARTFSECLL